MRGQNVSLLFEAHKTNEFITRKRKKVAAFISSFDHERKKEEKKRKFTTDLASSKGAENWTHRISETISSQAR